MESGSFAVSTLKEIPCNVFPTTTSRSNGTDNWVQKYLRRPRNVDTTVEILHSSKCVFILSCSNKLLSRKVQGCPRYPRKSSYESNMESNETTFVRKNEE
ncbi:hypothetical protein AVEN_138518-1 [Araneus ventricosus]|uniref:Uncharacterized protein n=1 Tax=Araneus ventricosus TaxID=182803 RepID=A0A4Y2DSV1_ARAVE|nr:hypothetical protein AVEN_138518-1 [Araneus ventricosus]